jgi:hypothetical protein
MAKDTITFRIDKQPVAAPRNWADVKVKATFDNFNSQANITIDSFEFFSNAKDAIVNHRKGGLTGGVGIFEGPCFDITSSNASGAVNLFDGYLDMVDAYEELDFKGDDLDNPNEVRCGIKKLNGLNQLDEQIQGITLGYLEEKNVYSNSDYIDVEWVREGQTNFLDLILTQIAIYVFVKETVQAIKELSDIIKDGTAYAGIPVTGPIISILWLVATIAIRAAYIIVMILQVIALMQQLINALISIKRKNKNKAMSLRTMIGNALDFFGYQLESPIDDMDCMYYMPSKPNGVVTSIVDKLQQEPKVIDKGIPNPQDFGYAVTEAIEIALRAFNARLAIVGNVVHLRTLSDPWWVKQATYTMPSVRINTKRYNTNELNANVFIKFNTDSTDSWTIDNFEGTNYEVITTPIRVNDQRKNGVRGLDEIALPLALGTRKGTLNIVEKAVLAVAQFAEDAVNIFGASKDFTSGIKQRTGLLKMSDYQWNVPKLLYLKNTAKGYRIPSDARDQLSAKALWDKYYSEKSFVSNGFTKQRALFSERIPFRFSDFQKLTENSYFTTAKGEVGKFTSLEWSISEDTAKAEWWVQSTYTRMIDLNDFTKQGKNLIAVLEDMQSAMDRNMQEISKMEEAGPVMAKLDDLHAHMKAGDLVGVMNIQKELLAMRAEIEKNGGTDNGNR